MAGKAEAYVKCDCPKCNGKKIDQVHWMRHNDLLHSATSPHCVSQWPHQGKEGRASRE